MLTLYHAPRSRSFRILWLLEEIGTPYELKIVPIRRGDGSGQEAEPAYRKIHPHAKVPAIVHDGAMLFETSAIALYLTDSFPEKKLGPTIGDRERGAYLTWLAYLGSVFEPALTAKYMGWEHRFGSFAWGPIDEVLDYISRTLDGGPYLLGERFSAADIVLGDGLRFLMSVKLIPDITPFSDYAAHATARPAYARAQAKDSG